MDKIFFYIAETTPLVEGLKTVYGDRLNTRHIFESQDINNTSFFTVNFSEDLNDYIYSKKFISDATDIIKNNGEILIDDTLNNSGVNYENLNLIIDNIVQQGISIEKVKYVSNNGYNLGLSSIQLKHNKLSTLFFPIDLVRTRYSLDIPNFVPYETTATKDFLLLSNSMHEEIIKRGWENRTSILLDKDIEDIDDEIFKSHKVCIIVQEPYDLEGVTYFTNKVWKVISRNKPFVIIGSRGYLDKLNKFGYRYDLMNYKTPIEYDYMANQDRYEKALDLAQYYAHNYSDTMLKTKCLDNQREFFVESGVEKVVDMFFTRHLLINKYLV